MLRSADLFDLSRTNAKNLIKKFKEPWNALAEIRNCIIETGENLDKNEYAEILPEVWVHKTAVIAPSANINAPCIIGPETEIRHCAFIRGSAMIGQECVVGNSTELKNVILFDGVQVPHYNYIGDSILGFRAHMGAGAITSNVKSDRSLVTVKTDGRSIETKLKKFGAIIGDRAEIGCNSVLNPGTVIGAGATVYPLSCVRGFVPPSSIYKTGGVIVKKEIR